MKVWWVFVLLGFLLCMTLVGDGGTAGNDLYEKADLAAINHPDLFKTFWHHRTGEASVVTPTTPAPTPVPTPPKIDIKRPVRGKPIPLDRLDSSLVQRVFFDYRKAVLKPQAKSGIQINTAWFKKHTEYDILVEGHCDERGTNEYNMALGQRRGESVCSYTIDLGLPDSRISVRSWGEEKPLDVRQTEEAYALNRRVEFYAIPK